MQFEEIQRAVRCLPPAKRRKLTTWMVTEFPALSVDRLIAQARRKVTSVGPPEAPTADNVPTGRTLAHAKRTAQRLGIAR